MLLVLSIILLVFMGIVGGERGLLSLVSLIFNVVILLVYIYGINFGINIIFMTLICSILFLSITLFYQNGINIKTVGSFLSVLFVEISLGILVSVITYCSKLAGYNEFEKYEESIMYLSHNLNLNMEALVAAVVLLAMLGAIMDTSIAISTSVFEISRNNEELTMKDLLRSGKNVGKDILGTTSNTLFLAGIGETIMLSILMVKSGYGFEKLINSKAFLQEIFIILFANIGCLIIIPVTIFMVSFIIKSDRKEAAYLREYCRKASSFTIPE